MLTCVVFGAIMNRKSSQNFIIQNTHKDADIFLRRGKAAEWRK